MKAREVWSTSHSPRRTTRAVYNHSCTSVALDSIAYSQTLGGSKKVAITFLLGEILGSLGLVICVGVGADGCADQHGPVDTIA